MHPIQTATLDNPRYPASLKQISDAPEVLYYQGVLPGSDEPCVAVVGTRLPTPYGRQAALHIAGQLADAGMTVVSGLAPGIDTLAHTVCVERGRRTIAVLGTGLSQASIYPRENVALAEKILETGGCLVSELPPEAHGSTYTFPRRNRIISALSAGVLVVEAKEKSGSLITADYARKQGKKLFAVPGQIFTANAKGPNALIRNGAMLIESAQDILRELSFPPTAVFETFQKQQSGGNPEESAILAALREEALSIDDIIKKTSLSAPSVAQQLALLEISGKIRNLGGNVYGRT